MHGLKYIAEPERSYIEKVLFIQVDRALFELIVLIALVVHFQPVESTVGGAGHLRDVQLISGRFDHQLLVVMPQLR